MKVPLRSSAGWVVFSTALIVRVWVLIDAMRAPFWKVPIVDELAYLERAQQILQHVPLPMGAHYAAPGYAWILTAVFRMGLDPQFVKFAQLIVGCGNAMMVYLLASRWFSWREGLVAGLFWAIYPSALFHEVLLLKPTFAVALTLGALLALSRLARATRFPWLWASVGGLLLGLASLLRGETILVGLALAVALVWRGRRAALARKGRHAALARKGWRDALVPALALVLAQSVVVAIPTVQNISRGGGFVILAYSGGVGFYMGNNPAADGSYLPLIPDRSDARVEEQDAVEVARARSHRKLDAAGVSRFWRNEGLGFWKEQPLAALQLSVRKLALLWGPHEISDVLSRSLAARWVKPLRDPIVGAGLVLPLALVGLFLSFRREEAWLCRIYLLAAQVSLVPFFLFERFRLPMIAAAAIPLAAHALVRGAQAVVIRQWKQLAVGILAAFVFLIAVSLVRLDRDTVVLRVNVGSMLLQSGRYTEALKEFQTVEREQPSAWRVEMNIAATYAAMGHTSEALRTLRSVLEKLYREAQATGHPAVQDIVQCHELAGDLLSKSKRPEEARKHYETALRFAPKNERLKEKQRKLTGGG